LGKLLFQRNLCYHAADERIRLLPTIRIVVIILIVAFWGGFGIAITQTMPDHAIVLLDDKNHTYLSPMYAEAKKSQFRVATAAEAHKLKYQPDNKCRNEDGFIQEDRSLSGYLLVRLGILPPLPSRWNADGTWNW
jgi:hypothetical protein